MRMHWIVFDSCMHSFFALTDVGQVAHPTACLGALVEPVCRSDRPGLPLTIGSPGLPLYLPYIYIYQVCVRTLQREYAGMSIDTYLIESYISLEVWRKFARKPNMLRPEHCSTQGSFGGRRCSQPNTTLLLFSRNLACPFHGFKDVQCDGCSLAGSPTVIIGCQALTRLVYCNAVLYPGFRAAMFRQQQHRQRGSTALQPTQAKLINPP